MDNRMLISAIYNELIEHQRLLMATIKDDASLSSACVYTYPKYSDADIGKPVEEIPISPFTGEAALSRALAHLFDHKLDESRSGRLVRRLPGTIVIEHPEPISLLRRMHKVNQLKNELQEHIQAISPDLKKRHELISRILPDLVRIMATRDILYANKPLISVGFTWKHRQSSKTMGKSALLDTLQKTVDYFKTHQPAMNKHPHVEEEMDIISRYPANTRFVQVRPIRVSPAMNLRYQANAERFIPDVRSPVDMVAHSPLWIVNQIPVVHPFHSYDSNSRNQSPRERVSLYNSLVIPRLHIYLKESEQ